MITWMEEEEMGGWCEGGEGVNVVVLEGQRIRQDIRSWGREG